MSLGRRLLFIALLAALPLAVLNVGAVVVVRAILGVSLFDREQYLQKKRGFVRAEYPEFVPHPFVGQISTRDMGTGGTLSGVEPLYAARPTALPAQAVRVLVLGGSLAKHLSRNDDSTRVEMNGRSIGSDDILTGALNDAFGTDRFVVYNAATGGGKQPQQLFRLQYLLLLGEQFDVVVNLDGFNEVALPLVENVPAGLPVMTPRAYPQLLRAPFVDASCVRRNNAYAASYSRVPLIELGKLLLMRLCVKQVDAAAPEEQAAIAQMLREPVRRPGGGADDAILEAIQLWARSSEALERLATSAGAEYIHVLQPNQYLTGSKPIAAEERAIAFADSTFPYRRAIEAHYGDMDLEMVRVSNRLDARRIFSQQPEPLYRDQCCHLNNRGVRLLADAIVAGQRARFAAALAGVR